MVRWLDAALLALPSIVSAGVCTSTSDSSQWAFSTNVSSSYSCISSGGGVNDLGTFPTQCENDPASVRIEITPGLAECLVAVSTDCKIPMHDFVSLDYDFNVANCMGIWAAPLWMTPDTWQWGGGSGEIDSLEFCARDAIHMNFAGGGHQVELDPGQFSIDQSGGHVTVRKDEQGIVTIVTCAQEDVSSGGQCDAPVYADCDDCLNEGNGYGCWCNAPDNIYGSGGCQNNTDCMWTLVSDIWNGVDGDDGYYGCMTAVPALGLDSGVPNLDSTCAISVEKILVRGGGPNDSMQWGEGSPALCGALTTNPTVMTRSIRHGAIP